MAEDKDKTQQGSLEDQVHRAMKALGWLVPETDDEVAQAEAELEANPVPLPDKLLKVFPPFENVPPSPEPQSAGRSQRETEQHLARAAREGGDISAEVEERMKRDRERAERESEQSD